MKVLCVDDKQTCPSEAPFLIKVGEVYNVTDTDYFSFQRILCYELNIQKNVYYPATYFIPIDPTEEELLDYTGFIASPIQEGLIIEKF